jgi:hypothetical protein
MPRRGRRSQQRRNSRVQLQHFNGATSGSTAGNYVQSSWNQQHPQKKHSDEQSQLQQALAESLRLTKLVSAQQREKTLRQLLAEHKEEALLKRMQGQILYSEFFNSFTIADPQLREVYLKNQQARDTVRKTGSEIPPSNTPSPAITPRSLAPPVLLHRRQCRVTSTPAYQLLIDPTLPRVRHRSNAAKLAVITAASRDASG